MPALRWSLALIVAAGCGSATPSVGRERGPCRDGGACDPGLQCLSQVCVEISGEHCAQAGQHAAALLTEAGRTRPLLAAALGAMPARVGEMLTAACTEDGWSRAATRCVQVARDPDRLEACLADLPPGPRAALGRREAELAAAGDRVERDPSGTGPLVGDPRAVDPGPAVVLTGTQLGPRCEAYLAILTRYGRCPSMPAQAQKSIADAVVSVRSSFGQVPAASRMMMEDGCDQATASLTTALQQLGCP